MSGHIVIVDPSARANNDGGSRKRLSGNLAGKVIGIIDNTKPNFDVLADEMAALLMRDYGVASIIRHRKRAPSVPATEAMMREFQEKCDLVIAGSGD
jgi:hypothetical protein